MLKLRFDRYIRRVKFETILKYHELYQCLMNAAFLQARRAAADAAAGAAETIARMRLETAATITESADRLVKVQYALILVESTCDLIPVC